MQNLKWVLKILSFYRHLLKSESHDTAGSSVGCNAADRAALLSFKAKIVKHTTGILESWLGSSCCDGSWEGIGCNPSTGRVTSLVLQKPSESGSDAGTSDDIFMLSDPIPVSLCSVASLSDVSLSDNQLTGRIPEKIGGLESLTSLSLSNNHLIGQIPETLGRLQNLWYLNLSRNGFLNSFPRSFGKGFPSLLSIDLSYNSLSLVTVPDWILIRGLTAVHLAGCGLKGTLPTFKTPTSLTSIDFSNNHFVDGMSTFLAKMSILQFLKLSNNQLNFDVSKIVLPKGISSIDLSSNQLIGPLSAILNDQTTNFLEVLDIYRNIISGTTPDFKEGMPLKFSTLVATKLQGIYQAQSQTRPNYKGLI